MGTVGLLQDSTATTGDIVPTVVADYDADQIVAWGATATTLLVTIGGSPSTGAGTVYVEYSLPLS